jgi:hypothetical protein
MPHLAAMPGLQFSAGFVDITPEEPVPLAGYGWRTIPFEGVADPLEANAVVIREGEQVFVFVTFDFLYIGAELRERLEHALHPLVAPQNLFLCASHTHFAPATDSTLPKLGVVDRKYFDSVVDRVATLLRRLMRLELMPLELGVALGAADNSINRRSAGWRLSRQYPFVNRVMKMKANRHGPKNETVGLVRLGSQALIWHYACHPVFTPRLNHVSADFVGFVRSELRKQFGPSLAVLFWQGFSGNTFPSFARILTRPLARIRMRLTRQQVPVPPTVWQRWAQGLAAAVVRTAARVRLTLVNGSLKMTRASMPLERLLPGAARDKVVSAHSILLGPELQVVGVSAEMMVEHLALLRTVFGNDRLFCVGCIDGVFGYIPTSDMVRDGGYEAREFLPSFSLQGQFAANVEEVLRDQLLAHMH